MLDTEYVSYPPVNRVELELIKINGVDVNIRYEMKNTQDNLWKFDSTQDFGIGFRINDGGTTQDALFIYGSTSDVSLLNGKNFRWGGESGSVRIYGNAASGQDIMTFITANSERFRIGADVQLGVGGANFGTDGQVLTSNGTGAAPAWEDAGGGGASMTDTAVIVWSLINGS